MSEEVKKFLNADWFRTSVTILAVGGGVYLSPQLVEHQLAELQSKVDANHKRLALVEAQNQREQVMLESDKRFMQSDGAQLEMRSRDYTEKKVSDALHRLESRLIRIEDKLDSK